jgi:ATP-dependent Clp protease, protease subunit
MAKVSIKGVIVSNDDKMIYDFFDMDSTSPRDLDNALSQANGENVEVEINSPGGDVFAGSEMYYLLKEYSGKVTSKIVGLAASSASFIPMASDRVLISPVGQVMIHNAWSAARGDYRDMEHNAKVLKGINETITNAYSLKSGLAKDELLNMMDEETWLTPQEAVEKGFADEIMYSDIKIAASVTGNMLPQEVIEKVRNQFFSNFKSEYQESTPSNCQQSDKKDFLLQQKTKLEFLKLKGV